MRSQFLKVALAALLTAVTAAGLIGVSSLIVFADLQSPKPTAVGNVGTLPSAAELSTFTAPQ
jgi:hypothetical protein